MGKPLTWPQRFERAESHGGFTSVDRDRAAGWTYCAVGEHNKALPKQHQYGNDVCGDAPLFYDDGEDGLGLVSREDADELTAHGVYFYEAVLDNDVVAARELWDSIDFWYRNHPELS